MHLGPIEVFCSFPSGLELFGDYTAVLSQARCASKENKLALLKMTSYCAT